MYTNKNKKIHFMNNHEQRKLHACVGVPGYGIHDVTTAIKNAPEAPLSLLE
jgi:hypothetical protein